MKKVNPSMVVILLVTLALLCGHSQAKAPSAVAADSYSPMKFKVASPWPPQYLSNQIWGYAYQLITQRTKGAHTFEFFHSGAIGAPEELLSMVEKNLIGIAHTNQMYTIARTPIGQFEYSFPFPPSDPTLAFNAKKKVVQEIPAFAENLAKYNAFWLSNIPVPRYAVMSKVPITKLADFKGKKMGVVGKYFGQWMKPAGIVPVVAPSSERYTMLQTGVIDMSLNPINDTYDFKHYEVARNLLDIDVGTFLPGDCLINLQVWNGFSPDLKKIWMDAFNEAEQKLLRGQIPETVKMVTDGMIKAGVQVVKFPPEEKAKWAQSIPDTAAAFAAEAEGMGFPGWQIVEKYYQVTTDMGYKWPRKWGAKPAK